MYFVLKTMEVIGWTLIKKVRDTALCNLGKDYFSSDFAAGFLGEGRMCYVIASNQVRGVRAETEVVRMDMKAEDTKKRELMEFSD